MSVKSRLSMAIVSLGVVSCISLVMSPPRTGGEDQMGTPMKSNGDVRDQAVKGLRATIESAHYDQKCGLLSVKVCFENVTGDSLFLVTNDFGFVRADSGAGNRLRFEDADGRLVIDLSHTPPTAAGYRYFRSEEGSYGFLPEVLELAAHQIRNITYVFQFPVTLDFRVSDVKHVPEPKGTRRVSLRFGFGRESFEVFRRREFREKDTIEKWHTRIVRDWQQCTLTDPAVVRFAGD